MTSLSVDNREIQECEAAVNKIAKVFTEELNLEVPSTESDLFETGLLDSLKFVELLVKLEEVFGTLIAIEDLEIDNFRSIRKIAAFVTSQSGD